MSNLARENIKRRPTPEELKIFSEKRIPDLTQQYVAGMHDPVEVDRQLADMTKIGRRHKMAIIRTKQRQSKFEHLCNFEVAIPVDYKYHGCLGTFRSSYESKLYFLNKCFDDPYYMLATNHLVPGLRFCVKVFGIVKSEMVGPVECLEKIRVEGGVLVGAQGIALAYQQGCQSLPLRSWCVSFDEEKALWSAPGYSALPALYINLRKEEKVEAKIDLASFETMWYGTSCILVFVPMN